MWWGRGPGQSVRRRLLTAQGPVMDSRQLILRRRAAVLCQALVLNSPSVLTRSSQHPGMEDLYCLPRATDMKQKQGVSLLVSEPGFRQDIVCDLLHYITCLSKHFPCPVGTAGPIARDTNNPQKDKDSNSGARGFKPAVKPLTFSSVL